MSLPGVSPVCFYPCAGPSLIPIDGQRANLSCVMADEGIDGGAALLTGIIVEVTPGVGDEDYCIITGIIQGSMTHAFQIVNNNKRGGALGNPIIHVEGTYGLS
jgi:hypothetical protein